MNGSMAGCFLSKLILFLVLFPQTDLAQTLEDSIPMNQIRVLASHNSYKVKPSKNTYSFVNRFSKFLSEDNQPYQLNYGHLPIREQFENFNIRGLELDVYNDPKGGLYYKHPLNLFIKKQKVKQSSDSLLRKPGFKLLHIPDIDYETHYQTLEMALEEIGQWSLQNPSHAPIFVNIELKGSSLADEAPILRIFGCKKAISFDKKALHQMDSLFGSMIPTLFKASDFRMDYLSNQERISKAGWPQLYALRGKVFVIVQGNGLSLYPSEKANAFKYSDPTDENGVFVLVDNPLGNEKQIFELSMNHMIRTRTDAGTIEARKNDYHRLLSAMKSGAQILSTDYYQQDPEIGKFCIPFYGFIK